MAESDPPPPEVDTPKAEAGGWGISPVWLVPLLALIIAVGVAWRTYSGRGPLIEIVFENAAGVEAGQTTVRFRDVNVGLVERLDITPDLKQVIVTARIGKDVAHFVDADAKFWVVRPSVTSQGVTGIETVISGVYIAAAWDDQEGARQTRFEGLPRPPLTPDGAAGIRVSLRSPDGGSMNIGAPVLFHRIQVGQVEDIRLTEAGDVMIDLFVNAPNQLRLTEGTRFWNASGFSIELGAGGASLNVDSLLSLLQGGVSFDTVGAPGEMVEPGHVYELFPSETAARQNLFEGEPGERVLIDTRFEGSVQGLRPGAPVQFNGIDVGEVAGLRGVLAGEGTGQQVALQATLSIVAPKLGVAGENAQEAGTRLLADLVADRSLRARLASSGLITQTMHVELVEVPDAPPATLDVSAQPNPLMPSVPSDDRGLASSAQGLMERLTELPLEEVVQQAVTLLANVNSLVTSPGVRAAPENLGQLIADIRRMVDESGLEEVPAQVAALLASAQAVLDQAEQARLVANLSEVLTTAKAAVASVGTAAEGVPEMLAEIEALAAKANALPLDELVASAAQVVDGMDALVRSEEMTAIPVSVAASIDELRGIVADLRSGGAVDNVNATLASVRQLADEASQARLVTRLGEVLDSARSSVASVGTAADGVPPVLEQIDALAAKANALPLDELVVSATRVVDSLDAFVSSEGVANLPDSVQASLGELRGVVADLRAGGAVENANLTLASLRQISGELAAADLIGSLQTVVAETRAAAANVSTASEDLPELIDSLTTLSANASKLPLDQLVASGTRVLDTADGFLASQGVTDVPPRLAAALEELRAILAELREGGAVGNVNTTLASADRAADAVTAAAGELPALVAKLGAVADRADAALATVSPNSQINRDTLRALQEIRDAARSINSLVQALERRPNSVLFGR